MEQFVEKWSDWMLYTRNRSQQTEYQYRLNLKRWFKYCEEQSIDPLNPPLDRMQEFVGVYLFKQGLGAVSRTGALMALRSFYGYLAMHNIIATNPAKAVSQPALGRSLPGALPTEYAQRMLHACDLNTFMGVRDVAMLAVLIGCGVRASGLMNLHDEDLLFQKDEEGREYLTLHVCEKGKKERFVPVPDDARLLLRAYLGHPDLKAIDRRTKSGKHVLFVTLKNRTVPEHEYRGEHRRFGYNGLRSIIGRLGRMTGTPEKYHHPHAFRHLYGQELAEANVDPNVRGQLLGHEDINTTKIYDHIATRKLRREANRASPFNLISSPARALKEHLAKADL